MWKLQEILKSWENQSLMKTPHPSDYLSIEGCLESKLKNAKLKIEIKKTWLAILVGRMLH